MSSCTSCEELRRELGEQKAQVARYEGKIRDTVSAYKMLESQKQSLEVALSVLSIEVPQTSSNAKEKPVSDEKTAEEGGNQQEKPDQLEALKQAIASLTLVNKRKEMEFKRDRRTLMEGKEELQRRCEQLEQQLVEQKRQSKSQNLRRLREQLADCQAAQERAMTEHGMMLAEMQQQYGKEKRRSDALEKQVTEMSQRLAAKDELIKRAEAQLKEMVRMEQEMQALRKKAELTPTVRVIRDELANVKASSEQEVSNLRTRFAMQSAQLRERDARIEQLEHRVHALSERSALAEQQKIEAESKLGTLERELTEEKAKLRAFETEKQLLEKQQKESGVAKTEGFRLGDTTSLEEQFRAIHQQLKAQQPELDIAAILQLETPSQPHQPQRPPSLSSDTTGPISLGLSLTPSSTPAPMVAALAASRNASSVSLAMAGDDAVMGNSTSFCDSCMASRRELDYFKSLIGHLQRKLGTLEESHERTKKEHENASEMLRERIVELESSQHRQYAQLTAEAKQRVTELEEELQKQRVRVLEIVAEKDREIELTKNTLANFYTRNYGGAFGEEGGGQQQQRLPMDPAQPFRTGSVTPPPEPPFSIARKGSRRATAESKRKDSFSSVADRRRLSITSVDEAGGAPFYSAHSQQPMDFSASHQSSSSRRTISRSSTLHFGGGGQLPSADGTMLAGAAARNIFYEQELCKREQEIGELRNVIRLLELKVRDIEQAMLLKDVQYLQIIEALKEEIRVLEGRLTLASSQTNLAYLRNIFIQFLNQNSASGRKHILKAIGAVLQLTQTEMQRVDRWSH